MRRVNSWVCIYQWTASMRQRADFKHWKQKIARRIKKKNEVKTNGTAWGFLGTRRGIGSDRDRFDVHTAGTRITTKRWGRWGRCRSLRTVHSGLPTILFALHISFLRRRAAVYSEAEAPTQRSLIMCRPNGNVLLLLTNVRVEWSSVSRICNRTRQYSSSTIHKRLVLNSRN